MALKTPTKLRGPKRAANSFAGDMSWGALEARVHLLQDQDLRRSRTVRTILHEVGNHLNAIGLVANYLLNAPDLNASREEFNALGANIRDIGVLMNDLLDFANLPSGNEKVKPERLNLPELHHDVAFMLEKMAAAKGLHFSGAIRDGLDNVISDGGKLRRIALNLGINAVKYTRAGSVSFHFAPFSDRFWAIEVRDTGPGIPPEESEHIFEEFMRLPATTDGQPGAGLGLGIVRQLVHLLKGHLELESEVGRGTCFRVLLPMVI